LWRGIASTIRHCSIDKQEFLHFSFWQLRNSALIKWINYLAYAFGYNDFQVVLPW